MSSRGWAQKELLFFSIEKNRKIYLHCTDGTISYPLSQKKPKGIIISENYISSLYFQYKAETSKSKKILQNIS